MTSRGKNALMRLLIANFISFVVPSQLINGEKNLETDCGNGLLLKKSGVCLCYPGFSGRPCRKDVPSVKQKGVLDMRKFSLSNLLPDYDFDEFESQDDPNVQYDASEVGMYERQSEIRRLKFPSETKNPFDIDLDSLDLTKGGWIGTHSTTAFPITSPPFFQSNTPGETAVFSGNEQSVLTERKDASGSGERAFFLQDNLLTNPTTIPHTIPHPKIKNDEESASGSGIYTSISKSEDEPTPKVSQKHLCNNGDWKTVTACSCNPGFTGEFCEAEILPYSGSGEELEKDHWTGKTKTVGRCFNGVPVYHNTCICHYGYTGVTCDALVPAMELSGSGSGPHAVPDHSTGGSGSGDGPDRDNIVWSRTPMDLLPWKHWSKKYHTAPTRKLVPTNRILEDTFVIVSTGINDTGTELHISRDLKSHKPDGNIYRFFLAPNVPGIKSRLEITTCFVREEEMIEKYNKLPDETEFIVRTSCQVVNLPQDHIHTYSYEIYIPKDDFESSAKYIITQWHGTPDPTILRDEFGCMAQVRIQDLYRLCSNRKCAQGSIFSEDKSYIGIRYNQGGYPPLAFWVSSGYLMISARSNEKVFIDKGGCGGSMGNVKCTDHPREHYTVIWKQPVKRFKFDEWVRFRWAIKWSEYSSSSVEYDNGGIRTSNAWIRVWMNDDKIVDWIGPCGRNDNGRIPYFKAGVYNPSGGVEHLQFFFRRYKHSHEPAYVNKDDHVRQTVKKLKICTRKDNGINQNAFKKNRFTSVSSKSERKCTLHPKTDPVSYLRTAKLNRMLVDPFTKKIITNLIQAIDVNRHEIQFLQKKLKQFEGEEK